MSHPSTDSVSPNKNLYVQVYDEAYMKKYNECMDLVRPNEMSREKIHTPRECAIIAHVFARKVLSEMGNSK